MWQPDQILQEDSCVFRQNTKYASIFFLKKEELDSLSAHSKHRVGEYKCIDINIEIFVQHLILM